MEQNIKQGRVVREQQINAIVEKCDTADALVFNDYRGLSVSQISEIRRALAQKGAKMHVHKNRLMKRAAEKKQYPEEMTHYFTGPTAITYVKGDVSPVLKMFFDFQKKEFPIEVRGAFFDDIVFDAKEAEKLSKLLSKEELLAQLMGAMNAPVQNLALGLNDVIIRFARVLKQVGENKKE